MTRKNILVMVVLLAFMGTCRAQGYPPYPEDALVADADCEVVYIDDVTGDVTVRYTLILENISRETLEKVILKDFQLPYGITMDWERFTIEDLGPLERVSFTFEVMVEGWGLNPTEQIWEIYYTVRIEKGDYYTEQYDFFYELYLYPAEEASGSQVFLVTLVVMVLIVIAVFAAKKIERSEKTEKSSQTTYSDIVLQAMKNIKSEVLIFGVITAAFLIGLACFGLEVVRELKWAFVIVLIVCLVFYFLMKREENTQERGETADHGSMRDE